MPRHISILLSASLERKNIETWNEDSKKLKNHPWAVWASESLDNFWWLASLGKEICVEYSIRHSKYHHPQEGDIDHSWYMARGDIEWPHATFTPLPQCVPEKYKSDNAIETYRLYYLNHVIQVAPASCRKNRKAAEWWARLVKPDRNL